MTEVLSPQQLFTSIHDIALMAHNLEQLEQGCEGAPADVLKEVLDIAREAFELAAFERRGRWLQ
jgi:hypothetical protein